MRKFIETLLWTYIILLPINEVPRLPFLNQKVQYADLVFIILFIMWLFGYAKGKLRLKMNWFDFFVLLLLLAYIPSFYNSTNLISSIIELSGLIYLASLYLLIKNLIDVKEKLISLAKIWVITSVIVTLIGLVALAIFSIMGQLKTNIFLFYTEVETSYHILPRIDSVFRNANMYASYLLVSIVFAFILLRYYFLKKRVKFLIICALAILFLGAFFSGSRQQIGIYLSSFLILLKFDKNRVFTTFKYLLFFIFIILLIIGTLTTFWVIIPINFKNDIENGIFTMEINSKYSWHSLPHAVSINMIKRHPIIGVGSGNYYHRFREFVDWKKVESSYGFIISGHKRSVKDRNLSFDPLSTYLGSFAETGLIGFGALLTLLISFVFLMSNLYKNKSDSFEQQLSWFILSGFIGFLINGFIIEMLTLRHFWVMMAVGLSSYRTLDYKK